MVPVGHGGPESASAEAEITAASEYAAQTATAIRQRTLPAAAKPDADLRLLAARRAAAAAELRRQMALINLEFAMERIFSDDSAPRGAPGTARRGLTHDPRRSGSMRVVLALIAAFAGGYAAVYGLQRFAPDEVLAAVSFGLLPTTRVEDHADDGVDGLDVAATMTTNDDDDDDDAPVALLEIRDDERVLIFPPGVAEANGVVTAPVRTANWVERYTKLGTVLDVASLLRDVAALRGTELVPRPV